jgi:hypothetical protein
MREPAREKVHDAPLGVIDRTPWDTAADKANVAATSNELQLERGIALGDDAHLVEHFRWEKWVVHCAQEERRDSNARQVVDGARLGVVVQRVTEPMYGCRYDVIEVPERMYAVESVRVAKVGVTCKLLARLGNE